MNDYLVFGIGLLAQLLFSARLLVQWLRSEKAGRVVSPTLFWQLSLLASFLLMVYGILRDDLVIILGQLLSYFIYIRNLQYKNAWRFLPLYFKTSVLLFPLAAIFWLFSDLSHNWHTALNNPEITGFMLSWGSAGQFVFTFRFVYQWYYSEKQQRSVLPAGFWGISMLGSAMIMAYGIYRHDPVILLGQAFGMLIYIRNLYLHIFKTQVAVKR